MKYLVIECVELGDQWECDANRTPICVTDDYKNYNKQGYEIYEILEDGKLKKIRDYNEVAEKYLCFCVWPLDEDPYGKNVKPLKVEKIREYDKPLSKKEIERLKKKYGFKESSKDIAYDLKSSSEHGEEANDGWYVIGVAYDDEYPKGY